VIYVDERGEQEVMGLFLRNEVVSKTFDVKRRKRKALTGENIFASSHHQPINLPNFLGISPIIAIFVTSGVQMYYKFG